MRAPDFRFALKSLAAVAAMLVFLAGVERVHATPIYNVSTGFNTSGQLITSSTTSGRGTPDGHWDVIDTNLGSTYNGAAYVVTSSQNDWYSGWLGNGPNSDWIALDANTNNNGQAPYTFSTTFNMTGYDLSTASLSGSWAIDDGGTLSLNGNSLGTLGSGQWGALTAFSAPSSDFVSGVNTLSITITDSDFNLEAVRLQGSVSASPLGTATPEPASLTLMGLCFAILGGYRVGKHRRSTPQPSV